MTAPLDPTRSAIAGQFHAALKMLARAIELCPEPLWLTASGESPNRFWHIAYHSLFYTHFYLGVDDKAFIPWPHHRTEYNYLGENFSKPGHKPVVDQPYTKAELLAYLEFCHQEVDRQTAVIDLEAPSGFSWLPFAKLELQFYNLRHLAHHTGQLAERIRSHTGVGVSWVR
ncbi:MAG TPA: DinB family protein [Acidobacteriaceae bacterium]|jgi:hypothetical protein|nr:DinB family protein [Acidobacteriaceae bacterium]